jgi:hypothetical protein
MTASVGDPLQELDRQLRIEDLDALQRLLQEKTPDTTAVDDHVRGLLASYGLWADPTDRTVIDLGDVVVLAGRALSVREELLNGPVEWALTWLRSGLPGSAD